MVSNPPIGAASVIPSVAVIAPVTAAPTISEGNICLGFAITKGIAPSTKKASPIIYAPVFAARNCGLNFLGNKVAATAHDVLTTIALLPTAAIKTLATGSPLAVVRVDTANR